MSYLKGDFLLENKTEIKLYETYTKGMPIFDYHFHLSEMQILGNKRFNDIAEDWLGGNHYKWRLMRNCDVPEELITGSAEANVAVRFANYGIDCTFVSKLPNHEIGQAAVDSLRNFGARKKRAK